MASLILCMAQKGKNKEKQKPSSLEETVWTVVCEGSPGGRSTAGSWICETGRFWTGSEREAVMDEQSGESEEENWWSDEFYSFIKMSQVVWRFCILCSSLLLLQ